jgi:hypothetical protein
MQGDMRQGGEAAEYHSNERVCSFLAGHGERSEAPSKDVTPSHADLLFWN